MRAMRVREEDRRWRRGRNPSQWFCLVAGLLLALRGAEQLILGASFATPGDGWRGSQQLLTGMLLLLAQRDRVVAFRALIPFALFYTVLAIVGDLNGHEAFGLLPVDKRDLFVHPLYAVLALLIIARGGSDYRALAGASPPRSSAEPVALPTTAPRRSDRF